jgi:hypothetical protein
LKLQGRKKKREKEREWLRRSLASQKDEGSLTVSREKEPRVVSAGKEMEATTADLEMLRVPRVTKLFRVTAVSWDGRKRSNWPVIVVTPLMKVKSVNSVL